MPIVAQEPKIAVVKIGGEDIDLSSFTLSQLQNLHKDVQAMMRVNNDLRKAGKRDMVGAIRIESLYVGLNRFVQEWIVYHQHTDPTPAELPQTPSRDHSPRVA